MLEGRQGRIHTGDICVNGIGDLLVNSALITVRKTAGTYLTTYDRKTVGKTYKIPSNKVAVD